MEPARIAELLEPFLGPSNGRRLTTNDLQNISTYIDLLLRWNARINLTAIRDPEQIVTRHFGESFFAASILFPNSSVSSAARGFALADLGSGAGFPGIPIKLWAPDISLTLIESNHRKAAFLGEVVRALRLTDVNIRNVRAETLPEASFAVVTVRAVERFESALPIAARLLAPRGSFALLIGSSQFDAARSTLPNIDWAEPQPVPLSSSRVTAIGRVLTTRD